MEQWKGFAPGVWQDEINVRNFIQKNYTQYTGDDSFLQPPTEKTKKVWGKCEDLLRQEMKNGGVLDVETKIISGIDNFAPGYIDKENEVVVGLQTDAPLKRIVNLYGGMRMAKSSLEQYGYQLDPTIEAHFSEYRKTHNDGVFDAYPKRTRVARHAGLLTGLPDAYGRGRIIGDYRRVALYGVDRLIEEKKKDLDCAGTARYDGRRRIRLREEVSEQIACPGQAEGNGGEIRRATFRARRRMRGRRCSGRILRTSAAHQGTTTARPCRSAASRHSLISISSAIWTTAFSTEAEAQELVDQFVIKLRMVRHLRTPEYNELFGGDPTWVTESHRRHGHGRPHRWLPKTRSAICIRLHQPRHCAGAQSYRACGASICPRHSKQYCAKMSIDTDSIQYENDDIMRPMYGDDYAHRLLRFGHDVSVSRCSSSARAAILPKSLLLCA